MFLYFLSLIVVLLSLYLWKNKHFFSGDILKDHGNNPKVPFVKNGFNLALMTPVELFQLPRNLVKKYGNKSFRASLFNTEMYEVMKAKDAEKILSSFKHLEKGFVYNLLDPFLKTGLLTSHGDKWFTRRRMLTPAFHFNILKEYFEIFKEESVQLVKKLRENEGKVLDIIPFSTQFTLNTVCESAMGIKLSDLGNNGVLYRNNIYLIGKSLVYRSTRPWLYIDFIYSLLGHRKMFDSYLKPIQDFTQAIINKRRAEFHDRKNSEINDEEVEVDESENVYMRSKKKRYAMMDTLLQAQSEGLIDDEGIIEETDTFTFEGHDTTSAGMTFTLLLLAHHPEVQEKLFEEIEEMVGEELYVDTYNKMPYMDRVLKESLRIYPPVPFISRTLTEDFQHDGELYKKGMNVELFIYDIHRDPEYFPDPETFNPDRFLPEECEKRHNFAYLAFSAGMRNCIGQKFAILELKVMLTKVIQNFKILPVTRREDLVFIVDLVLRTNHPVKMKFVARD